MLYNINKKRGDAKLNERLKKLRKALDLTQQQLAEHLGVKRNTVAQWELGINAITEQVITSICREFDVNKEWLRTGEGEMFVIRSNEEELAAFFGDILNDGSSFKKRFISALAALDTEDWEVIEKFINSIIAEKKERGEL
jgi:transcriptional regulator with XRE-family HTH domain